MPRQFGKVDASARWARCPGCRTSHRGRDQFGDPIPCPPPDRWLVLHFCPFCNEAKDLYCRTHRDRHMPTLSAAPDLPPEGADSRQRAAGEGNEGEPDDL